MKYDYLIVGAGLYGAAFAQQMTAVGKRCLVIDRRPHIAGNAHCEVVEGIQVHRYGAHIFHTSDEGVWEYVNRFVRFNHFVNSPVAIYHDELYNLPFNMNTFSKLWNIQTPAQAQAEIQRQAARHAIDEPQNLEEQALKLVGDDIYQKLIKGYTEKQWGRDCKELPPFILKRVPLRFTFDNNYFTDPHQGIPLEGYDALVERLLTGSDVLLSTPYEEFIAAHPDAAWKTVYTGTIDGFFHYCYGPWEYPAPWQPGEEPYYPVNDEKNQALLARYQELARSRPEVLFGGRLGSYRYYNMDQVIRAALDAAAQELA